MNTIRLGGGTRRPMLPARPAGRATGPLMSRSASGMPARIAGRRRLAFAAGAWRLPLLVPMAACLAVAWLMAALITGVWAVLVDPPRRRGGTMAD